MLKLKRLAAMCCAAMLTLGASALAETQVNVTALKGPTAMGMVKLMDEAESRRRSRATHIPLPLLRQSMK